MHTSLIFLFLISIILIVLMITCFICFIRSRRKEEARFMEQIQYGAQMAPQSAQSQANFHHHQPSPKLIAQSSPSMSNNINNNNNNNNNMNNNMSNHSNNSNNLDESISANYQGDESMPGHGRAQRPASRELIIDYQQQAGGGGPSPYQAAPRQQPEIRSDITQQINSAIIGSADAEFQNDFIQVFPMYQIAPQPEKNTTPYLT